VLIAVVAENFSNFLTLICGDFRLKKVDGALRSKVKSKGPT